MYFNYAYALEASTTTDIVKQNKFAIGPLAHKTPLAKNPHLAPKLQLQLCNYGGRGSSLIRIELARNPSLIPELQYRIMQHGPITARRCLTMNENLMPDLFQKLIYEYSGDIFAYTKNTNFKYKNPETQILLEKYLLLV